MSRFLKCPKCEREWIPPREKCPYCGTVFADPAGSPSSEPTLSSPVENNSTTTTSGLSALSDGEIEALLSELGEWKYREEFGVSAVAKLRAELARRKGGEG